jgi:ribose/xylose/arabinose/galactoside ABC-type transport system permease subunit
MSGANDSFAVRLRRVEPPVGSVALLLCVFLSLTSPAFLTTVNLFGVARAFSLTAIVAIGQTLVILTGGIDLSVGSVLALAGLSTGMLLQAGWPLPLPPAMLGFELPVIADSVIGGTSLMGGEGTVLGAVLGAAIMGVLENGMVLLGVSTYAQQAVTGTVILLAVALDIWQKRRRGSR